MTTHFFLNMMEKMAKTNSSSPLAQLENTLDLYCGQKAPALPTKWKETIVKVAPWITLIFLLLSLPAVLALLGIGALLTPVSYLGGPTFGITYTLSLVFLAITIVLEALSLPGLFKKSKQGWSFVYYSTLVGVISNIVYFNPGGIILGTVIPLYFLFQIKSYYK